MRADVDRFRVPAPGGVSGLQAALDGSATVAARIVALLGKTPAQRCRDVPRPQALRAGKMA